MAKIIVALAVIVTLLVAYNVNAESYMTFGYGQASHHLRVVDQEPVGNTGFFWQPGYDHEDNLKQNAFHFGFGWKISKYFDFQLGYYDLGEWNQFAGFTPDDRNFDRQNGGCHDPCLPTAWSHNTGHTQAITLSILPTLRNHKFDAYARFGLAFYRTKNKVVIGDFSDPLSRTFYRHPVDQYERGLGPVYGLGVRFKNGFYIDYIRFEDISSSESATDRADVWMIGITMPIGGK